MIAIVYLVSICLWALQVSALAQPGTATITARAAFASNYVGVGTFGSTSIQECEYDFETRSMAATNTI